jgi:hypothetical protein
MDLHMPEAPELSPAAIRPTRDLLDSTDLLGDSEALKQRYEADGYMFFRGLLDFEAVAEARRRMTAPLVAQGLVADEGDRVRWIGGDRPSLAEDDPAFSGVAHALVGHPANQAAFEKILGEKARTVPMVQYRAYKPNNKLGGVHQDGFYSPGILGYRPLWLPLVAIDAEMGGLVLAPRHHQRGFFHDTSRPPRAPIREGVIADDAWAWTSYQAGDVVVIHPYTPHVGLPNHSEFVRLSIDTRIQSAANPTTLSCVLEAVEPETITLKCDDGRRRQVRYDGGSFLRIGAYLAARMTPEEFRQEARLGMALVVSVEDDRALMVRRAQAG